MRVGVGLEIVASCIVHFSLMSAAEHVFIEMRRLCVASSIGWIGGGWDKALKWCRSTNLHFHHAT